MPRFYFHLVNDVDARDLEGKELRNLTAAREHARRSAIFSAAESIKDKAHFVRSHRIQIEDADGNVLDNVRFGDIITVED